jgi:nucleoid-associated protein YgaU
MALSDLFKNEEEKQAAEKEASGGRTKQALLNHPPHQAEYLNQSYTVKAEDSLSKIAMEFYGNIKEWNKILEANKDQISNPNKIRVGQKLVIPN